MRKRTIKKQIWINQDEDLNYIKNTMPQFIVDFQKKIYSRGDDFSGSNKN